DKSVSFQEIKNKILNIIEFSIQLFAAICGNQNSLKLLFPNLGENISIRDARQQLKKIKNSVDCLKDVLDEFKKINVKDLDKSARVKIIDAINDILSCVSSTSEKLNNTVGFHSIEKKMPKVLNSVRTLNDCIGSIKTTDGKEKIKSLSDGIKEYMDVVSKSKITPDKLNHLNKISQVIIKFAKVQDPFTKFQKAFKEHVKDFEKYIGLLNKINIQKLNPYITFTDKSYELIRTGAVDLKGKSEFIIGILTKTVEKLNEAVTLMNNNVTNQQTENSNNNNNNKNSSHNDKNNSYNDILAADQKQRNYKSITKEQPITAGVLEDILTSVVLKVK
nr:hypothetical protein [Thomasclavelia ramosa]